MPQERSSCCAILRMRTGKRLLSSKLQEQRLRIDARMVVGQEVERHRRNFFQQPVQGRRIGCGGNGVPISPPDRSPFVPSRRKPEKNRFRHLTSRHPPPSVSTSTAFYL